MAAARPGGGALDAAPERPAKALLQRRIAEKLVNVMRPESLGRLARRGRGRQRSRVGLVLADPTGEVAFSFVTQSRSEVVGEASPSRWLAHRPVFLPTIPRSPNWVMDSRSGVNGIEGGRRRPPAQWAGTLSMMARCCGRTGLRRPVVLECVVHVEAKVGDGGAGDALASGAGDLALVGDAGGLGEGVNPLSAGVHDPGFGNAGAGIAGNLAASVLAQRGVGHFDRQQHVLGQRVAKLEGGTAARDHEVRLWFVAWVEIDGVLHADLVAVCELQNQRLGQPIHDPCVRWPDGCHLPHFAIDELDADVGREEALPAQPLELVHRDFAIQGVGCAFFHDRSPHVLAGSRAFRPGEGQAGLPPMEAGALSVECLSLLAPHPDGKIRDAVDEAREQVLRLANQFHLAESAHDFFPDDAQLHLCEAVAEAAVDAEAEGQMLAGVRAVDAELVGTLEGALVAVAGEIPHAHLVPLVDGLAAHLDFLHRRAAHVRHRRLPANHFGGHVGNQAWVLAKHGELIGVLVQGQHAAGDGIAGCVVAADDEQQHVAEELVGLHVAGGLAMHEEGNQVVARLAAGGTLLPHLVEILEALPQFLEAFLHALEIVGVGNALHRVRPVDQEVAVLLRHVEQGRQHLAGELHRHPPHPVEGLAFGKLVENGAGAGADQVGKLGELSRREHGSDHLALLVVLGRVFHDEHGQVEEGVALVLRGGAPAEADAAVAEV